MSPLLILLLLPPLHIFSHSLSVFARKTQGGVTIKSSKTSLEEKKLAWVLRVIEISAVV
jgi:hypothetical protein